MTNEYDKQKCPFKISRDIAGQHSRCITTCQKAGLPYMGIAKCNWDGWFDPFKEKNE